MLPLFIDVEIILITDYYLITNESKRSHMNVNQKMPLQMPPSANNLC